MDNRIDHIDELIGKFLAGEAAADETARLEDWLDQDPSNRRYFEQFQTIFSRAASVKQWQQFDTDAAWTKLRSTLKTPARTVPLTPPDTNRRSLGTVWRVAASIIVALGIGLWLYQRETPSQVDVVKVVADQKLITDTLPDGSDVVLNKTTTLAYVYDKRKKVHEVQLKGEAYFNIHHNGDEKFVIDAGGVFIRDIGTSFNVRAYPESDLVEVLVEEGEVIFYKSETQDDSSLYLRAGGKGVYNKKTGAFTVEDPEPNTLSYKTKFFTFSGQNLETVVETLNKVYDKKITVSKAIKKCPLTVSFNDETIEEIAQVIAETLGLTVTEANGRIVLEGESCR